MPPLDAAGSGPKDDAEGPLSLLQVAALLRTVRQALARGETVTVVSGGRILARYLPTESAPE